MPQTGSFIARDREYSVVMYIDYSGYKVAGYKVEIRNDKNWLVVDLFQQGKPNRKRAQQIASRALYCNIRIVWE